MLDTDIVYISTTANCILANCRHVSQLASAVEQAVPPLPVAVLGPIIKKSLPAWSIDYDRFLGDSLVIDF